MEQKQFKYFAFISYSSKDTEWGKKLQKKLEHYRMPATLCSEHGWERTPIKPVFFAPTDIQPGGLTEELQERLRASRNLIVIGSPNSAQSEWVGKEIEFFHLLGRTKQIHYFIVDGQPNSGNSETECYNPILKTLDIPEILGANIHERVYRWPWLNRERAYVQLISKLLGVEFDAIWQRHKRLLVQKVLAWAVGIIAVLAALFVVWQTNQPVNIEMQLKEASVYNDQLPPLHDAVVTMTLDNETKTDTIRTLDSSLTFANIPQRFLNNEVRITVGFQNAEFLLIDTTVTLSRRVILPVRRNPSYYGDVRFLLWNTTTETCVTNTTIDVAGRSVISDENGMVSLFIPLEEQRRAYPVKASFPLENDSIYMPLGEDAALGVK